MIWIGGLVLAVVLYLVGPDNFLAATLALTNGLDELVRRLVYSLGAQVFGVDVFDRVRLGHQVGH